MKKSFKYLAIATLLSGLTHVASAESLSSSTNFVGSSNSKSNSSGLTQSDNSKSSTSSSWLSNLIPHLLSYDEYVEYLNSRPENPQPEKEDSRKWGKPVVGGMYY